MAMRPREAAKAKGCIDWVISFTKTKLLPHVPEMTIRFTQRAESDTFPMRLRQIDFDCFDGKSHSGRLGWGTPFGAQTGRLRTVWYPPGFKG